MRLLVTAASLALAAALSAFQSQQPATSGAREEAYRANNAGVAALERFDYQSAATEFRKALAADPSVHIAGVNLAIAMHYAGDSAGAHKQALAAAQQMPDEPRAWFVAGLAARAAGDAAAATKAFERVLKVDPNDPATLTNLGQLDVEIGRWAEAIERLNAAASAEPFNATALYSLARALIRAGRAAEGQEAMNRFLTLRDAPYAITYANTYLQQGRYGEAVLSTGSETHLVDPSVPPVHFSDITADALRDGPKEGAQAIALADVDGDRDLDLLAAGAFGLRLFERDGASWRLSSSLTASAPLHGILAADYDNDGLVDVTGVGLRGITVWRQTAVNRFEDVTSRASLGGVSGGRTAAFVDLDHDGDVDFVVAPSTTARSLEAWRNNGNGTFTRFDAASGLAIAPDGAAAIVPTDFDLRRDVDLLIAGSGGTVLLENLRDGRFRDAAGRLKLPQAGYQAAAAGDANADGRTDFFLASSSDAGVIVTSDGATAFRTAAAPAPTAGAQAAQWTDYDADGALDLVTLGNSGLRVLRNTGSAWTDVSQEARASSTPCAGACALAVGDVDGDGDQDLVAVDSSRVRVWRNDGRAARALSIALSARVSNRPAAGSRVEMRAGSLLRHMETSIASPAAAPADVVFGLGARVADVVRVAWPSGIVQAEVVSGGKDGRQRIDIAELDRKPSSCPYLFTWNGSRFEFVTDFLGGGELGYWLAPGVRNTPDPEEYVRIRGDQLVERDGRYEIRVTNELEETLFLDRLSLVAMTHREGSDVYPNEGLFAPPFPEHRLVVTRNATVPDRVLDEHGHDVRELVSTIDRRAPSDFAVERFRGYAKDHHLELTVPARAGGGLVLLLTAWTDYAFSSDNVAASQAGLALQPPTLEIADGSGRWATLVKEVGIPVGRPQTVVVDLTGRVPNTALRLRVRTNMRIYWDRVLIAHRADEPAHIDRLDIRRADLRWRGYSAEQSPDGREPFNYDYSRVLLTAPWKLLPGRYTREGDVRELLTVTDDRFVVSRPGDEIALSFPALPPALAGWTRTFLLHADGFSKEMDPNSASPDVAAPLPYHGMRSYPDDALARRLSGAQRDYVERYNTRVVARPLPSLTPPAPAACCPR